MVFMLSCCGIFGIEYVDYVVYYGIYGVLYIYYIVYYDNYGV